MGEDREGPRWRAGAALPILAGGLLLMALCLPGPSSAGVRQWVDDEGRVHYTIDDQSGPGGLDRLSRTDRITVEPGSLAPELPGGTVEPPGTEEPETASPDPRQQAARELAAQIQRDRELLKDMISSQASGGRSIAEDPRLDELAERLPRLQAEYRKLQRETED